ncbi:MAG: tetratricopeptide repeat protein [Syntrophales bacterium]|nr:tetratricopeptide repeat protein [Syntrophales bacterium]
MAGKVRKVTKKELKQPDLFQSVFQKVMHYASENKPRIYLISGILILIFLISGGWYIFRLNHEKNAEKIYARAYDARMKGDLTQAIQFYRDVTSKYSDTRAATIAYYQLGNLYFRIHEIDASIKAYQEFLRRAPEDNDLLTLAYVGLGYCYESRKNFKDTLVSFEKAVKADLRGSFKGINYRNIARTYEQMNNRGKALEYYRKTLNKNKDPYIDLLIKRKISSLD